MKKKYHSAFIATYILMILTGVIWQAGGVSAQDTIKLTVNSHTTSTATMNNMKPGDEMSSDYTIINEGNEEFKYFVDFKFSSGDIELFNILQMTLEKEEEGTESPELKKGAGHYIGSAALGAIGNSVLAGHHDTVFRGLGELVAGDLIELESTDGTFTYKVTGSTIVDGNERNAIKPSDKAILTLITCCPFSYVGSAPDRFLLSAPPSIYLSRDETLYGK